MKLKIALFLALAMAVCVPARAQVSFAGDHAADSLHVNEVTAYLNGGYNTITKGFLGPTAFYTRHLTNRWDVQGGFSMPFGKNLYGISARGSYRLPTKYFDIFFQGRLMYNRYQEYRTNEFVANLSVVFESRYFMVSIGESLINYSLLGSGYSEPLTFTFGLGANIRPRTNPWNIGVFARNFDDFYYENWNINWGINGYATPSKRLPLKIFGEFNIRPAGSTSQLATKYETALKVGINYKW